jgi:PKD repeat protein
MRSLPLIAATTVVLATMWACGGDGGNTGPNNPPVAAFDAPSCTVNTPCAFTDKSTDDHGITSRLWNFGDDHAAPADNQSSDANPTHTYVEAKSYTVTLTVTDASGETNAKTNTVTVSGGGPVNQPPVASYTVPTDCTAGTPCGFHSTSTDADGTIASANWDFGDGQTGEGVDVTHTFAAAGSFNVLLAVTDDKGATNSVTQAVTVAPATSQDCTSTSSTVDCSLGITSNSTVTITVQTVSCELAGNRLAVTVPVPQTVFFNICGRSPNETYTVRDAVGGTLVLQAGSQLGLRFFQGTPDPTDPPTGDPGIQITGTFPDWTLKIDDGGHAGAPNEPDFNDAILTVHATTAP